MFLTQVEYPRIKDEADDNDKYVVKRAVTLHEFFLEVYYSEGRTCRIISRC